MRGEQRWFPHLPVAIVVLLAASLTVGACGGAPPNSSEGSSEASGTTTGTPLSPSATSTSSSNSESSSTDSDDELAWAPFGPDDPDFPTPGWDVYYYFLAHDCDNLQNSVQSPTGHLYESAVAVCRAAVNGEQSQWDVAATAFNARTAADAIGPAQCVDDTIINTVATLLAWHDQHPSRQPVLTFPQTADRRTDCSRDNNILPGEESDSTTAESTTETSPSTTTTTTTTETPSPSP